MITISWKYIEVEQLVKENKPANAFKGYKKHFFSFARKNWMELSKAHDHEFFERLIGEYHTWKTDF